MQIRRFSIVFAMTAAAAAAAMAAPGRRVDMPASPAVSHLVLVQSVKERELEAVPPVDAGREPPPAARTSPPAYSAPPPPVPPAPRMTRRPAPPAAAEDESRPFTREVPPPPTSTTRVAPPPAPRVQEPAPVHRAAPRIDEPPPVTATRRVPPPAYDDPPPARRADTPRRAPPTRSQERSAFYANCTQQCHLSCEASFEVCNGDSSPAQPACVKKLESCRVERCACRIQ